MVGFGYDVHRLEKGESLILGGVFIPSELGTVAHSDGDVLIHSLVDAILGAAGLGDIGEHFPDTDPKYKDADSTKFLTDTMELITWENLKLVNADIMVVMEKPKLSKFKIPIRDNIAKYCNIEPKRINIKATTNEKLGPIGRSEGVAVYCVCELKEIE